MSVTVDILSGPYKLGEGPHWDHVSQKLYFVDIEDQKILRYDPATKVVNSVTIGDGPIGFVIPVQGTDNKFVAGLGTDVVLFSWDSEEDVTESVPQTLVTADSDRTETRWNDAKADASGRVWGGTMGFFKDGGFPPNVGSFYSIDTDLTLKKHVASVTISNGIAWNSDNDTLYYIDSPTHQVVAFDYNAETGTISNQRTVFDLRENKVPGLPDGMTIDTDGNLWVAVYGGGGVLHINPKTGKLLQYIRIPGAENITSVAFGGPNFDVLYVTSANVGLTEDELEEQPRAGYLFAIRGLGVRGSPANSCKLPDKSI